MLLKREYAPEFPFIVDRELKVTYRETLTGDPDTFQTDAEDRNASKEQSHERIIWVSPGIDAGPALVVRWREPEPGSNEQRVKECVGFGKKATERDAELISVEDMQGVDEEPPHETQTEIPHG